MTRGNETERSADDQEVKQLILQTTTCQTCVKRLQLIVSNSRQDIHNCFEKMSITAGQAMHVNRNQNHNYS